MSVDTDGGNADGRAGGGSISGVRRRAATCGTSRALDGSSPCWLLSLSSHMGGCNLANASTPPPAKTPIKHDTFPRAGGHCRFAQSMAREVRHADFGLFGAREHVLIFSHMASFCFEGGWLE